MAKAIDHAWDIKKLHEQKKLILGSERTLKLLRVGKIKKIYLASNAPRNLKDDLSHYNLVTPVEIVELTQAVDELGTMCKRPFPVAAIGVIE